MKAYLQFKRRCQGWSVHGLRPFSRHLEIKFNRNHKLDSAKDSSHRTELNFCVCDWNAKFFSLLSICACDVHMASIQSGLIGYDTKGASLSLKNAWHWNYKLRNLPV